MRNAQAFAGICIMDVLYLVALVHIAHADLYRRYADFSYNLFFMRNAQAICWNLHHGCAVPCREK
jgi:hypothetical protein